MDNTSRGIRHIVHRAQITWQKGIYRVTKTAMNPTIRLSALGFGVMLMASGCSGSSSGATMAEPEATALPPIKVDLPPPPSFAASDIPDKNPDGSFTVRGLRRNKMRNCMAAAPGAKEPPADCVLNKDVKVKAYLLEVYQCPKC